MKDARLVKFSAASLALNESFRLRLVIFKLHKIVLVNTNFLIFQLEEVTVDVVKAHLAEREVFVTEKKLEWAKSLN